MPNSPTGTETRKISRHEIGASTPPSTSPTVEPATNPMFMIPSAVPRWPGGKASVTIALELPSSIAPPRPWPMRITISQLRSGAAMHPGDREQDREHGEDREAQVVDAHAAVDVAQAAEADDQHGGDDQEAHDHPQHVLGVAGGQRVDVDAAEDRGQPDQHDRRVDRDDQRRRAACSTGRPTCSGHPRQPPRQTIPRACCWWRPPAGARIGPSRVLPCRCPIHPTRSRERGPENASGRPPRRAATPRC